MTKTIARPRSLLLLAALAVCTSAAALSACNDDGDDVTGDIDISVAPTTLTIIPGGSAAATITIDRSGTFAGSVTLAVSGEPASLDAVLAPAVLGAGESTGTVTVTAAAGAVPGSYDLTLSASGSGVSTDDTELTVVVEEVPAGAR